MADDRKNMIINLTAVIVAVTDDVPRVLLVDQQGLGLPSGPFDPTLHESLETGLRGWVEAQTGPRPFTTSNSCTPSATAIVTPARSKGDRGSYPSPTLH